MRWIESLIVYFVPTLLLEGKPWKRMWEEKEREAFSKVARFLFATAAGLYLGHYFFYDRVMDLQPLDRWFWFRTSVALVSLFAFFFYISPLAEKPGAKIPAVIAIWVFCYTQAMITTWWDGTPWLFSFVFVIAGMYVLRLSPVATLLLATLIMGTQTPFLLAAQVPLTSVISTSVIVLVLITIQKSSHVADVRNFVLNQENIAAQKQIIELNIEFADRLRAFIPRVIADRLDRFVKDNRLTIIQAAVEVLRPRQVDVACMFSDIRGYTKNSIDLDKFIDKSVLPEMKACSNAVELYGGIPRKIGDLIFAYFDEPSIKDNVIRCLLAGMEISRINSDLNETINEHQIRRYILISSGQAVVGNLGGLDSSIEITALGPPVNYLSRLDELTKAPKLAAMLDAGDILICPHTASVLERTQVHLDLEELSIHSLGLVIRDFPNEMAIFRLRQSSDNLSQLQRAYKDLRPIKSELLDKNDIRLSGSI